MSLSLTRKTDYALVALAALAERWETDGDPLSAREIAERNHLPLPLLMNALKEMHRAGIIKSRRGVGGGYYLNRSPEAISLKDVVVGIEGLVSVTHCCTNHDLEGPGCRLIKHCPIAMPMQNFNQMLNEFLGGISLKSLLKYPSEKASRVGVQV